MQIAHSTDNAAIKTLDFLQQYKKEMERKIYDESVRIFNSPNRPTWQKEIDDYTLEMLYSIDSYLTDKTEEAKQVIL